MTIRSGYGLEPLHLRQPTSDLRKQFGGPMRRQKTDAIREYWFYPELGFECIVSQRSHRILGIFLHPEAGGPRSIFSREVSWPFGLTPEQIRAKFGKPNLEGGGFRMSDGAWVGLWFSYDTGIGFHFDQERKMSTVSIFARKRGVGTKDPTSVAAHSSSRIAALRRN